MLRKQSWVVVLERALSLQNLSHLYVLDNFQLILPSLQLLLDIFIAVNDDGEEDIDQHPAHRDSKEEEHHGGDSVRLLEKRSNFDEKI